MPEQWSVPRVDALSCRLAGWARLWRNLAVSQKRFWLFAKSGFLSCWLPAPWELGFPHAILAANDDHVPAKTRTVLDLRIRVGKAVRVSLAACVCRVGKLHACSGRCCRTEESTVLDGQVHWIGSARGNVPQKLAAAARLLGKRVLKVGPR